MLPDLTKRQRQILTMRANGMTVEEIGTELGITAHAVVSHFLRIRKKWHTRSTAHAVAVGMAVGEIGVHTIDIPGEQREAS